MGFSQSFETHFITDRSSSLGSQSGGGVIDYNGDGALDIIYGSMNRKEFFLLDNKGFSYQQKMISDSALSYNRFLKVVDMDMDGDLDYILSPNNGSNFYELVIYFNQGNGVFTSKLVNNISFDDIRTLEVFDFDNDGDLDILLDELNNTNYFFLFENDGNFNFTWQWFSLSGQPASVLGVADFDLNGYEDFLGLYYDFSANDWVLFIGENDSTGGFNQQNLDTFSIQPTAVIGDFFGSSHPDFVLSPGSGNTTAFIYENDGNGGFQLINNLTVPQSATFHYPYDFDNDGDLDFWMYEFNNSYWMRNNGVNSFAPTASNASPGILPTFYGDMNGDGIDDVVEQGGSRVRVHHGTANGQFQLFFENGFGDADHMEVFDVNGNGFPDVVLTRLKEFSYFTRDAQGVFHPRKGGTVAANSGSNQGGIVHIDKENDGDLDALIGFDGNLYWLENQNGNLNPVFYVDPVGQGTPTGLQKGDLDNDNNPDIVFATSSYTRLEQVGNSFITTSSLPGNNNKFALADVDNDNDDDIVSWGSNSGTSFRGLEFVQNNNGAFAAGQSNSNFWFSIPSTTNHISQTFAAGDFDNDGDDDFFVLAPQQDDVYLIRNEGGLNFTDSLLFDTLDGAEELIVEDLNLDGNNDIIIGDRNHQRVLVYYSDANGNLTSNTITKYCGYVDRIKLADMDLDGDLDIVTGAVIDEKLMWLENKTINCPKSFTFLKDTVCVGESISFGGVNISSSGVYTDTLTNLGGCDSLIELRLNNFPQTPPVNIKEKICLGDTTFYNGNAYFQSGVYTDTIFDQNQCEVPFQLNLTIVQPQPPVNLYDTICDGDSILFGGVYYSNQGSYQYDFTNAVGCDTSNILNLELFPINKPLPINSVNDLWVLGFTNLQWFKNDTLLNGETNDTLDASLYGSGNYSVSGTDGNGCNAFSDPINVNVVGINLSNISGNNIKVSPNPTNGILKVNTSLNGEKLTLQLTNIQGETLINEKGNQPYWQLNLEGLDPGVYILNISSKNHQQTLPIVKQ